METRALMKILLVNPAAIRQQEVENNLHPLGLLYIASYLREYYDDTIKFKYVNFRYVQEFKKFHPDVVFMTSVSGHYNIVKHIANQFKELDPSVPIIVGGYHISTLPQTMTEDMDIAVIGEGEQTIGELLDYELVPKRTINGIAYSVRGKLIVTKPRSPIYDIDTLPLPARDLISHLIKSNDFTNILTARGCPYNCIFCANRDFWGKIRFHSADHVVEELTEISEKYTHKITIVDDTFTINKPRLMEIVKQIEERGLDLEINAGGRADQIDEKTCNLLKRLGVTDLMFGFESGNQRILNYLKDCKVKVKDNRQAINLCNKYGIRLTGSFVIGSPDETREEILDTLRLVKEGGFRFLAPNILTPLPGTPLWKYALERGVVSNDTDFNWNSLNFAIHNDEIHKESIILSETLTRRELYELWSKFDKISKQLLLKNKIYSGLRDPIRGFKYVLNKARWSVGIR